jgi:ABC-type nitrate/sulfonate/bicarbonate transport system substrate-binding protein
VRPLAVAALAMAVALAAGLPAPAGAQPEIRQIAIGMGIDIGYSAPIVAINKGWFKEAGFTDVAIKTFPAAVLAGEALAAGQIQLWMPGNPPVVSMFHNGVPVVIIGVNSIAWESEKLVVRPDANVTRPEDLYRVRIGIIQGSSASAVLHFLAKRYGLDEKRLQLVNLPPPEQLASLVAGNIQAMMVWEPWNLRAIQAIGAKVLHTGLVSHFAGNDGERVKISNTRVVLVAAQPFVRKNPKTTRAMLEVMLRAQRYVADPAHREEVIRLFSDFAKQDVEINRAIAHVHVFNPAFDDAYVEDMERTAEFLQAAGRIKSRTHVLDYTYTGIIEELDPSLVKVRGRWKP